MYKKLALLGFLIFSVVAFTAFSQKKEKETLVKIHTDFGTMTAKLYNDTPKHRDNFIQLAKDGAYDGTLFHRVISGFMMQGGDLDSKGAALDQDLGYGCFESTIEAEILPHRFHKKGALSAARQSDEYNPEKSSSACQFYIVQGYRMNDAQLNAQETNTGNKITPIQRAWYKARGGTPFLDQNYTVFGEVIEGLDIIDLVCSIPTNGKDRPLEDLKMRVEIVKQ